MTPTRRSTDLLGLILWLLVCYAAAAIGARASIDAGSFYAELTRPAFAPPAWLFGPVWTALYTLMGVAAWLTWRVRGFAAARGALLLFLAQLALNALWSWLFFVWKTGAGALAAIVVLLVLIALTLRAFARVRPLAGALLWPYLAWVAFATLLTFSVWRANPQLLG